MIDKKDKDSKLGQVVLEAAVKSFFASGDLSEDDIKDKQLTIKKVLKIISNHDDWEIVTDYRSSLMAKAKHFEEQDEQEFAKLFYATFMEHSINGIIVKRCDKKKLSKKTRNAVIRQVNLMGKFGWLSELLELPKFNNKHLKTILKLADDRNAFVHYKSPPAQTDLSDLQKEKEKIKEDLAAIRKAVKYMNTYYSRVLYKGKKGYLNSIM